MAPNAVSSLFQSPAGSNVRHRVLCRSSHACDCCNVDRNNNELGGYHGGPGATWPDFDDDLSKIRILPLGTTVLTDSDSDDADSRTNIGSATDLKKKKMAEEKPPVHVSFLWTLHTAIQVLLAGPKLLTGLAVIAGTLASMFMKLFLPTNWIYAYQLLRELTTMETDKTYKKPPTVRSSVEKLGYVFEEHTVQTLDGYFLVIHRMYSATAATASERPVVFLQHGLKCSSADWVTGAGIALDFAERGYDVWMGNFRGNVYSRRHHTLRPRDQRFWDFSWEEHGAYDLPRMIDHVLCSTGAKDLR